MIYEGDGGPFLVVLIVTRTSSQIRPMTMVFMTIWASMRKGFATILISFWFLHAFFSVGGQPGLPSKHGVLLESIIQCVFHGTVILV